MAVVTMPVQLSTTSPFRPWRGHQFCKALVSFAEGGRGPIADFEDDIGRSVRSCFRTGGVACLLEESLVASQIALDRTESLQENCDSSGECHVLSALGKTFITGEVMRLRCFSDRLRVYSSCKTSREEQVRCILPILRCYMSPCLLEELDLVVAESYGSARLMRVARMRDWADSLAWWSAWLIGLCLLSLFYICLLVACLHVVVAACVLCPIAMKCVGSLYDGFLKDGPWSRPSRLPKSTPSLADCVKTPAAVCCGKKGFYEHK